MKAVYYIAVAMLTGLAPEASAQLYQESLYEKAHRRPTYDEFLIAEIRKFPDVKAKEDRIIKESNYRNLAVFMVNSDGWGTYTVKMLEDNGKSQITRMVFIVDSASGRIRTAGKEEE